MADETDQASDEDQSSDAYQQYIARRRITERSTLRDTKRRLALEDSGYRFVPAHARGVHYAWSAAGAQHWSYPKETVTVEGPLLSNQHRYVAHVWPLSHASDPPVPRKTFFDPSVYYVLGLTLVGVALFPLLLLIDIAWHIWARPGIAQRRDEAMADPARPWAWTASRRGGDPWPYVVVPVDGWSHLLRHPERIPEQPDRCVLEQVEVSKEAALDAANRVIARLSS
jgi:hypothetical protein